jgi:Skp family chaperone for outer membrane proteins
MTTEQQTKADLLTLIQGRNQRIAELELLVLDLNRKLQEVTNARDEEKEEGNEEKENEES